jgi:hypothetical protein
VPEIGGFLPVVGADNVYLDLATDLTWRSPGVRVSGEIDGP